MSVISTNYRITPGEHGLAVIEVSGRATSDESATLRAGVVTRYQMVPYPAARGAEMKPLDGSQAAVATLKDSTGVNWKVVKVYAEVNPMAPTQAIGMPHATKTIVRYLLRYQQVGRLA
ncbi:MAG: hypothetical protein PHR35_05895 [Kiritimatiellae bacterium]|nr:hypothetical protein [Kiritimatiellia bacterium]